MAHRTSRRASAVWIATALAALLVGISVDAGSPQTKPGAKAPAKPIGTQTPRRTPAKAPAPPPAARVERPVPFAAGETLGYDVSWSMAFVTAGTATLRVVDKHPSYGSPAYYIVGEGKPTPMLAKLYSLYYKADTLLDAYTLTSQRGSVYSDENGRKRLKSLQFNRDGKTATFEMQTSTNMKKDIGVPAQSQDALSALFAMRAMTLTPGATVKMPVCISDVVYFMTATVGAAENVKTGVGTQSGIKISPRIIDAAGKPAGRNLTLWLSNDARKVPLRLQADLAVGSFNLVLREAKY